MILEDNFKILESNADNTLFKAISKKDGLEVTIKKVSFDNMQPKQKKKLIDEVNILQALKCSSIVRYYTYLINKAKQELYIIMEYCPGGSLQEFLDHRRKQGQRLEEKAIWKIFAEVVLAVSEIHSDKSGPILHRNIGPNSFFMDKDNNVKMGNFSFIKRLDPEEKFADTYLPQISYLSPEQVTSGIFTQQTDIWQLGCLLYEMAALKPPFRSASEFGRAQKIRQSQIQPIPVGYSSQLSRVIKFCLNKDMSKRPKIQALVTIPEINYIIRHKRLTQNKKWIDQKQKTLKKKQQELQVLEEKIRKLEEEEQQSKEKLHHGGSLLTNMDEIDQKQNFYLNSNLQRKSQGHTGSCIGFKNYSLTLKKSK